MCGKKRDWRRQNSCRRRRPRSRTCQKPTCLRQLKWGGREQLAVWSLRWSGGSNSAYVWRENAGLDPIDIMVALRAQHEKPDSKYFGIEVFNWQNKKHERPTCHWATTRKKTSHKISNRSHKHDTQNRRHHQHQKAAAKCLQCLQAAWVEWAVWAVWAAECPTKNPKLFFSFLIFNLLFNRQFF